MSSPGDDEATLGLPHAGSASSARLIGETLGEVKLETCLVLGPGAWLYKGRDGGGRRALVQVSLLRRASAGEEEEREGVLSAIDEATTAQARDPEMKIEGQGFAADAGLGGALWWRLPWTGAAERIGQTTLGEAEDLIAAALSLLERLEARHARGRVDPLLDAAFVVPRTGGADLVGFPVKVPTVWLAPEVRPPHDAPEERSVGETRRSGDLWRLGHALRALSAHVEAPMGFEAFLDRLSDPDPGRRIASASDAMVELEGLQGTVAGERAELFPEREALVAHRAAPSTQIEAADEEEHTLADVPVDALEGPQIDPAVKPRASGADEAPTMWMKRDQVSKTGRASGPGDAQPVGPKGTVVGVRLPEGEAAAELGPGPNPRPLVSGRPPPTRVFDDPATHPPREVPAPRAKAGLASGELGPGGTVAGEPAPTIRGGGFGPGGTVAAERPPVGAPPPGGFPEVQAPADPRSPRPAGGASGRPPTAPEPEPLPGPSGSKRGLLVTLLALLSLAVLAGVVVQLLKPTGDADGSGGTTSGADIRVGQQSLTPWNDVLLETVPADAQVVGERDGQGLGPSPVRLLVPSGGEVAVLVTAPGYEPVRLVLPTRGRITVHLTSTGDVLDCPVEVQAPGKRPLEVVGLDITPETSSRRYAIPGAVVMRSPEGHGAWLVRCATYGGQRRHRFVSRALGRDATVKVTEPRGAQLTVGSRAATEVPGEVRTRAGFVKVEASTEEGGTVSRWIPAFTDTLVQLPRPAGKAAGKRAANQQPRTNAR